MHNFWGSGNLPSIRSSAQGSFIIFGAYLRKDGPVPCQRLILALMEYAYTRGVVYTGAALLLFTGDCRETKKTI